MQKILYLFYEGSRKEIRIDFQNKLLVLLCRLLLLVGIFSIREFVESDNNFINKKASIVCLPCLTLIVPLLCY